MRHASLILVLAALAANTACERREGPAVYRPLDPTQVGAGGLAPGRLDFDGAGLAYRSGTMTFASERGMSLPSDHEAWVGMAKMACRLRPGDGAVDLDLDPDPDRPETVVGSGDDSVVVLTEERIHVMVPSTLLSEDLPGDGVLDAEPVDGGLALLIYEPDEGCSVDLPGLDAPVTVHGDACAPGRTLTAASDGRRAWVPTFEGVVAVGPDGAERTALPEGLLVWSDRADTLFTAANSEVAGWTNDHAQRWSTPLEGTVLQLEPMGFRVAALVDRFGSRELWALDAATGTPSLVATFRAGVTAIAASPTGWTLAVSTGSEVHFLDVLP